jgi:hypothetical protein
LAEKKNADAGPKERHPRMIFVARGRKLLNGSDDDEHDEQCEQNKRLDQRKRDDHHRLNGSGSTRIAGSTFSGARTDKTLTDTGKAGRQAETDTGSDGLVTLDVRVVVSTRTRLRHCSDSTDSDRHHAEKNVFEFSHFPISCLIDKKTSFSRNSRGLYYFASPCGISRIYTPKESASPAKTA